jgi:flagellar biosynthetic protein FliR
VPKRIRIGLSFFVALLLYNVVPHPELTYESVIGYAVVVVKETITGLLIGFVANICSSIITFAGNIIDMDIGLSMATEFNPEMSTEVTISGNFYYYLVMLLLIVSDMHTYVLRAACDSFYLIPVGGAVFETDNLLATITKYMTDLCVIGFRIFLPVFACIMVLNCILGIMAKVAPQMNMFAVGVQLKVLVGLTVIFLTIFLVPHIANFIFREIKTMVGMVIESMY